MYKCVLLFALVALCLARTVEMERSSFGDFKATYNRIYQSAAHEAKAFGCFLQTLDTLDAHAADANRGSATFGLNKFSDMCAQDFADSYLNFKESNMTDVPMAPTVAATQLTSFDWRAKGGVTHVKNQGHCGSCWAFSTTGAIEGAVFAAHGQLVSLSEQNIVSCNYGSNACQGGSMAQAFGWVKKQGGIATEDAYPYNSGNTNSRGECKAVSNRFGLLGGFTGYWRVSSDEEQMATYVAENGPVSVAVYAPPFQHYTGGIFQSSCNGQLDHGVLVVGFGTENNVDFWIVKNSWDTTWGEQGYIRIQRGVNKCGIASQPLFPHAK